MIRIGRATRHNNEGRGFHAPGTTGPFGGAVAVGRLLKFDAEQDDQRDRHRRLAGLRASGVRRARAPARWSSACTWAAPPRAACWRQASPKTGFTGPRTVLEGPFGFLNVYCGEHDVAALTRGLGDEYATLRIMLKRFPVHITSHTSVQAIEDLRREHGYTGERGRLDPRRRQPEDGDRQQHPGAGRPDDGAIFAAVLRRAGASPRAARSGLVQRRSFNDPAIRALASRVTISVADEAKHGHTLASTVTVTLKDGRALTRRVDELQGHAGTAARPRRDAREIPAADPPLRPRRDGSGCSSGCRISRTSAISTGSRSRGRKRSGKPTPAAAAKRAPEAQETMTAPIDTRVARRRRPAIADAARCLAAGGLVAFPTETVYGLGADATNGAAVARLYAAKGRPSFNPLIAHVSDLAAARAARGVRRRGRAARRGVLAGAADAGAAASAPSCPVAELATAGLDSIAVRVPDHRGGARACCARSAGRWWRRPPTAPATSRRPPRSMCWPISAAAST